MPLTDKQKIELTKKRLNIPDKNPFESRSPANKNNVMNKRHNQSKKGQEQEMPVQKFTSITDERPQMAVSEVKKNFKQTQQIREQLPQAAGLETSTKAKSQQEIYMEIMHKSKQAKKERQMLKEELDNQIKKLDSTFNKVVQQSVPLRLDQSKNIQSKFQEAAMRFENDTYKRANQTANTAEEIVRVGADKLQKLEKHHKEVAYTAGGDDDDIQYVVEPEILEANENQEEVQKPEVLPLEPLTEYNAEKFSKELEKLPFVLSIPDTYAKFSNLLNRVSQQEEIVVLDRLIKSNSTFVNKANQPQMELLISHLFKRILTLKNFNPNRVDAELRALRHCANELPHCVAGQFNVQFQHFVGEFNQFYNQKSYFPGISLQFIILLRVFQICFLQTQFSQEEIQSQAIVNFYLVSEYLIYRSAISNETDLLRLLFLVKVVTAMCMQCGKYNAGVVYGLQRVLVASQKMQVSEQTDSISEEIKIKFTKLVGGKVSNLHSFIMQEVKSTLTIYYKYFKFNFEILPSVLGNLMFNGDVNTLDFQQEMNNIEIFENEVGFVLYNTNTDFLPERVFQIKEQDPLFMKHFNPKKTNDLDIQKQKERIEDKKQKRVEKDVYRREVKQIQKKMLEKQNAVIQKSLSLQKAKNQAIQQWGAERKQK
ncbi:Conserved_hypothetical protein [Hexamita inflata]|uniref:Uncharacterized protein n=1 Tax=Hexamita inflata TaxID=28002 RepID=A0AA86R5A2_9EUKA|nr:Conserved hypothetical protein [Hexamita inflata]